MAASAAPGQAAMSRSSTLLLLSRQSTALGALQSDFDWAVTAQQSGATVKDRHAGVEGCVLGAMAKEKKGGRLKNLSSSLAAQRPSAWAVHYNRADATQTYIDTYLQLLADPG